MRAQIIDAMAVGTSTLTSKCMRAQESDDLLMITALNNITHVCSGKRCFTDEHSNQ